MSLTKSFNMTAVATIAPHWHHQLLTVTTDQHEMIWWKFLDKYFCKNMHPYCLSHFQKQQEGFFTILLPFKQPDKKFSIYPYSSCNKAVKVSFTEHKFHLSIAIFLAIPPPPQPTSAEFCHKKVSTFCIHQSNIPVNPVHYNKIIALEIIKSHTKIMFKYSKVTWTQINDFLSHIALDCKNCHT